MKDFKTFLEAKYGLRSPISVKKGDILRKQRNEPLRKKHSDIGQDDTNIEKNVISKQLKRDIKKVLSKLTDREALVIRYRFGLDGEKEHTLDQIEKKLKVSRERIRQIEITALRKLKHASPSKLLRPYTEKVSSSFMEAKDWKSLPDDYWVLVQGRKVIKSGKRKPRLNLEGLRLKRHKNELKEWMPNILAISNIPRPK